MLKSCTDLLQNGSLEIPAYMNCDNILLCHLRYVSDNYYNVSLWAFVWNHVWFCLIAFRETVQKKRWWRRGQLCDKYKACLHHVPATEEHCWLEIFWVLDVWQEGENKTEWLLIGGHRESSWAELKEWYALHVQSMPIFSRRVVQLFLVNSKVVYEVGGIDSRYMRLANRNMCHIYLNAILSIKLRLFSVKLLPLYSIFKKLKCIVVFNLLLKL